MPRKKSTKLKSQEVRRLAEALRGKIAAAEKRWQPLENEPTLRERLARTRFVGVRDTGSVLVIESPGRGASRVGALPVFGGGLIDWGSDGHNGARQLAHALLAWLSPAAVSAAPLLAIEIVQRLPYWGFSLPAAAVAGWADRTWTAADVLAVVTAPEVEG